MTLEMIGLIVVIVTIVVIGLLLFWMFVEEVL